MRRINPFGELIGLTVFKSDDGYSECGLGVHERLLNPNGILHGGVVYSLADTGMGAAVHTRLPEGRTCATIEIKIVYLRPVTSGDLLCRSKAIRVGERIAVVESDVENGGRLIARALGTFSIVDRPPGS